MIRSRLHWLWIALSTAAACAAEPTDAALRAGGTTVQVVSDALGGADSEDAPLAVVEGSAPAATITSPAAGSSYRGGQTITFSATATDAEDGVLPASAFTWQVVFHQGERTRTVVAPLSGQTSGSFEVPRGGHSETAVFYRIHLQVRDASGLVSETYRDVVPQLASLTLLTSPPGLRVTLDGAPLRTPSTVSSVVGSTRTLGVVSPQFSRGTRYTFNGWSDGGALTHAIEVPVGEGSYAAWFTPSPGCEGALRVLAASASSVELGQPQLVADNAVDGDLATRWSSAFSDPQWLLLDLGSSQIVTGLVLNWEAAFGRDYRVEVADGENGPFSTVITRTGFAGGVDTIGDITATGRFVRIYIDARATHWGNSLYEVQVLGSTPSACGSVCGDGTVETGESCDDGNTENGDGCSATCAVESTACANNALPRVAAVASSVENSGLPASGAIDGNTSTRWSSAFSEPQWIYVDLGATRRVKGVVLRWETAHARDYRIELADDPSGPWDSVFTRSEFAGGVDTIQGLAGRARYLRVYVTQRATAWGSSLYELEVLGDEDPDC